MKRRIQRDKVYYCGTDGRGRNEVRIILSNYFKEEVCQIDRNDDRIVRMKSSMGEKVCSMHHKYGVRI